MYMAGWSWIFGLFGFLIWLGVVVYVLVLATRFVKAVEQIAEKIKE